MGLDFYDLSFMFFAYSILGWVVEVMYATVDDRMFLNRGMLFGTICPIYGIGVIGLVWMLFPFRHTLWLLFLVSVAATTLLELITGFILHRFFHQRWWDYRDERFNWKGYICLKFSLAWGAVGVAVVTLFQPLFLRGLMLIPREAGVIILTAFYLYFIADIAATALSLIKSRFLVRFQTYTAYRLLFVSDTVGERIFSSFFAVIAFGDRSVRILEGLVDEFARTSKFKRRHKRRSLRTKRVLFSYRAHAWKERTQRLARRFIRDKDGEEDIL